MASLSLFLRLLESDDKAAALGEAVAAVAEVRPDPRVFEVAPESFAQVPGAPFAYWVSEAVRGLFRLFGSVEKDHLVASGTGTLDDFRFLRVWWEVVRARKWFTYAKGGSYAPYYYDHHLCVDWLTNGREMKAWIVVRYGGGHWARNIRSTEHYFRPGLTWPRRTNGLSFRAMPAGCIFADKGPAAFVEGDDPDALLALCALVNSVPFGALVALQLARTELAQSYEVGLIQQTPVPPLATDDGRSTTEVQRLATLAHRAWSLKRDLDTATLTSHALVLPALLQMDGPDLMSRVAIWAERVQQTEQALAEIQAEIDARCFDLYGFDTADQAAATQGPGGVAEESEGEADEEVEPSSSAGGDPVRLASEFIDWLVGAVFGRFDLRLATGERSPPTEPEPFDHLPVCSPGMLTGDDGLLLSPAEGRRQRAEGRYLLDIAWDGILVDDPEHPLDIEGRVRDALAVIWGDRADAIQQEASELLGVPTLREWFRRPAGFFADHLKRYSKSRRQAPIYWPLSTPDGRYTIWLYYHRFSKDTLYRALEQVQEKLDYEERKRSRLTADAGANAGAAERAALADQESFVTGLRMLREELTRVAPLWSPDLNDGVILNYGPFWRMIGHTPWQKAVKAKWDELVAGKYDWAHLAMHLWPERVVPKCAKDRSLAIAHGVEEVFWEESSVDRHQPSAGNVAADSRRLRTDDAKPGKWQPRKVPRSEIDRLIAERTSAAVKDALKSLLEAPAPVASRGGGRRSPPVGAAGRTRSGGSSGKAAPAGPDSATLEAVRQAIAAATGGVSKSDVLAATGLTDAQWNAAISALFTDGSVIKSGAGRGTRYHSRSIG